jgi:hypothetical protein
MRRFAVLVIAASTLERIPVMSHNQHERRS